jgi:type II secretory pathway pseudopilin PulG
MIVATIVGAVIMVFVLSLLLVSYSLFTTAARKETQLQCQELARSVNQEIRQELMKPDYDTYEDQLAAVGTENDLWFFLRYNLWQDDAWPYFHEGESGHNKSDSYRYFTIDATDAEELGGMADQILITMYWEIDSEEPAAETDKSFTTLHIKVEAQKGDCAYAMESAYALTVIAYDSAAEDGELEDAGSNPFHEVIDKNEKWAWEPD